MHTRHGIISLEELCQLFRRLARTLGPWLARILARVRQTAPFFVAESERLFWMTVRRALLMIVRAIELRWQLTDSEKRE